MSTYIHYCRQTPEDEIPEDFVPCCMGSAEYGPNGCECWVAVYDPPDQETPQEGPVEQRAKCCIDCAYRNGSPEKETEDGRDELEEIVGNLDRRFACHHPERDGLSMRRVVEYRHPDGRVKPAEPGEYQPPQRGDRAYMADGAPAPLCAGWKAQRDKLLAEP